MTRHDVAMSLALIGLKIHRIFARRTHARDMHIHQRKGLSGFSALIPVVAIGLSCLGQK